MTVKNLTEQNPIELGITRRSSAIELKTRWLLLLKNIRWNKFFETEKIRFSSNEKSSLLHNSMQIPCPINSRSKATNSSKNNIDSCKCKSTGQHFHSKKFHSTKLRFQRWDINRNRDPQNE